MSDSRKLQSHESEHYISVYGSEVRRDCQQVRITGNRKTGDLRVGCTEVTRLALLRLVELSNRLVEDKSMEVLQDGAE